VTESNSSAAALASSVRNVCLRFLPREASPPFFFPCTVRTNADVFLPHRRVPRSGRHSLVHLGSSPSFFFAFPPTSTLTFSFFRPLCRKRMANSSTNTTTLYVDVFSSAAPLLANLTLPMFQLYRNDDLEANGVEKAKVIAHWRTPSWSISKDGTLLIQPVRSFSSSCC
jgi:hypothetical protein